FGGVIQMNRYRRMTSAAMVAAVLFAGCGDDNDSGTGPVDDGMPADPQPGQIQTWAGNGFIGFDGDGKKLLNTSFYQPIDVTIATDGTPYVLDWNNHRVRQVQDDGTFKTIMGNDILGD